MQAKIHLCGATVKQLEHFLRVAFQRGDVATIKRISALLMLNDDRSVELIAQRLGVCTQTIYNWLHAFVLHRWASLRPRTSPGRPAKLSAAQKQQPDDLGLV